MKYDVNAEIYKTRATVKNLIDAIYRDQEKETNTVDVLASLLAISDQLERVDNAISEIA